MLQETGPRTGQVLEDTAYIDLRGFDGDAVDLSEINWLSQAEFHRLGPDLVIESPSGEKIFLVGYYESETPPDLSGLGGAQIPAHIVDILSGPRAPGQFAQANGAVASEPIGQVETAEGAVFAVRVDGTRVQLKVGDPIYQGDTLETGEDGIVGVTFVDNSTLSLDEDGRMVIDELVYDPGTQDGSASMFVLQGAMSFVSGQLAKANPDAMQIETPVATIGIRGTSVLLSATPPEPGDSRPLKLAVALMPEGGPDGQTFVGEAVINTQGGSQVIGGGFQAVTVDNPSAPPSSPQSVSLNEIGRVFGGALSANPNRSAVPDNVRNAVEKVVAHKKAEDRKADLEARLEEAKAKGEDTSELEADLQEATEAEQELKQEAEGAVEDVAQELGNPDLMGESNLTGKNEPVDNGDNGDGPDEPVQTPPDPPGPVSDPPPPPDPVTPPVPPGPEPKPLPPKLEEGKKEEQNEETIDPNKSPQAQADTVEVSKGIAKVFTVPTLLGNDSDPDGDPLRVTQVAGHGVGSGSWSKTLTYGVLSYDGSQFTYTPNTNATGVDTIQYAISDGEGGSNQASVTFNVTNTAPSADAVTLSGVEDSALVFNYDDLIAQAGNTSGQDVNGDTVELTSVAGQSVTSGIAWGGPITTTNGTLDFDGSDFYFTPDAGFTGTAETVAYVVSDGTVTASGTATINVGTITDQSVTQETVLDQTTSSIGALEDGGWVVAWQSLDQDGDSWGVYAQMYNADGSKRGDEFLVNDTTTSTQTTPKVLGMSDGDFVIAWNTYNHPGDAFAGTMFKRFSNTGVDKSGEIHVNNIVGQNESGIEMAALPGGEFALTYLSDAGDSVYDTTGATVGKNYSDVMFKIYDSASVEYSDLLPITTGTSEVEIKLNDYITQHQDAQSMAVSGTTVMTIWKSDQQDSDSSRGIYGRTFDTSTETFGSVFQLNSTIAGDQNYTDLVTLSNGNFVAVWQSDAQDTDSSRAVVGRVIDASGTPVSAEFILAETISLSQDRPQVSALSGGQFVAVWQGQGDDGADATSYGIYGRIFNADGSAAGSEFLINDFYTWDQTQPSVTTLSDGDFVVSWSSDGQDGSGQGVYQKRFNADGTEDTTTVPTHDAPDLTMSGSDFSASVEQNFSTAPTYRDVKLADIDGDGDLDAILASNSGSETVSRINDGTGTFGAETSIFAANGDIVAADFNGDGKADFASASGNVYISNGDGTFTTGFASSNGTNVGAADIDGDGDQDLIVVGPTAYIYTNDGSGAFTDTGQSLTMADQGLDFGDFDQDGDLDMVVGNGSGKLEIWENDGSGNYSLHTDMSLTDAYGNAGSQSYDVEVADFNGDGLVDIWTTNGSAGNILLTNDGEDNLAFTNSGTFGMPNDREGSSSGDLDGDGDIDVITDRLDGESEFWINDGTGNFTDANSDGSLTTATTNAQNSDIGDLNGDGLNDVFLANVSNNSEVLINTTKQALYNYSSDTAITPFSTLNITDSDSTELMRASIKILGYQAGDMLTIGGGGAFTSSFNASTGVLDIYGSDTIANYLTAIQGTQFTSSIDADGVRGLELTIGDESGTLSTITSGVKFCSTDPIVLDLDGDGVELTSGADGVAFDVNADGDKEQIGWVGSDDGVLAFDVNQDGLINDMSEVISHYFAYQDRNSEGLTSSQEVLALYDDNGDNVIDVQDEIYQGLSVWQDVNGDGITDEGELRTLADEGIQSINLDHTTREDSLNGNLITKSGTAMSDTGEVLSWNEVAFELDEAALLKEIVGTEQDVDTSVLPRDDTTAPRVDVITSQPDTNSGTAVSEQDSYTTTGPVEDSVVLPAAE